MKNLIKKIPKITLVLIVINVLIFLLTEYIIGEDLKSLLASNPIDTDGFYFFQIITSSFVHSNFEHIFTNLILFIIFSPSVEIFLGSKKFIYMIILSSILNFLTYQISFKYKHDSDVLFNNNNLSPKDIKYNKNFEIDYKNSEIFKKCESNDANLIIEKYIMSKTRGCGFSVCISSIMVIFLLLFNIKKPILSLFSLFFVLLTIYFCLYEESINPSHILHLSGFLFGFGFIMIKKGS